MASHQYLLSAVVLVLLFCSTLSDPHGCVKGPCHYNEDSGSYRCINRGCRTFPNDLDDLVISVELQGNYITKIPAFDCADLARFNMSTNVVSSVSNGSFVSCPYLTELDLSFNQLSTLPDPIFPNQLFLLHLQHNQLSHLPNVAVEALSFLDVSYNRIESIDAHAFKMTSELQTLDLSFNQLRDIHADAFDGLQRLKRLNLKGNHLKVLEDNIFHTPMPGLNFLDLSRNNLNQLDPNAFTDLKSLESLDISYNRIESLSDMHFLGLEELTQLHLHHNRLSDLTEGLVQECDKLKVFDVSYNPVKVIDQKVFEHKLAKHIPLEKLTMNHLDGVVNIVEGTFHGLDKLREVNLSHCDHLSVIDQGAFDSSRDTLRTLDLSHNNLLLIQKTLVNWTSLSSLDLSGNPWKCDCSMEWMKNDLFPEAFRPKVICEYPSFLSGSTISEVSNSQLSCNVIYENRRGIAVGMVLLLTAVFTLFGGILVHKYRHRVLPCCYNTPMYRSFYNPLYTEDSQEIKAKKAKEATVPTAV